MATEAILTGIEVTLPDGPAPFEERGLFGISKPTDTKRRSMTITYEWEGKGTPPNLKKIMEEHPQLVKFDLGAR